IPIASKKIPSVAPVDIDGSIGTPGKYLSATLFIGPTILGSSFGGMPIGRIGVLTVTVTLGPASSLSLASVPSTLSPGKIRQLMLAVALCGSAFSACPALSRVATHVVRSVECIALSMLTSLSAAASSGLASKVVIASATGVGVVGALATIAKKARVVSVNLIGNSYVRTRSSASASS